jgi:beta-glucosidase 2, glycosyl-hydrolase family 116 N-term
MVTVLLVWNLTDESDLTQQGAEVACAVCAQCTVAAEHSSQMEFSLTWDMPLIQFGSKESVHRRLS